MKKQTKSFLVEVKRSRLAASPSAVQRLVWPDKRPEASARPIVQRALFSQEGAAAAVQEERRVLPDLMPTRVWEEPDPTELEIQIPSPSLVESRPRKRKASGSHKIKRPEAAVALEDPMPPAVRVGRKRLTPWLRRTLKDLPPGQRWKRHLPRWAW
jgi:hypothetical protein